MNWAGSTSREFRKLIEDIKAIIGEPAGKPITPQTSTGQPALSRHRQLKLDDRKPGTIFRDTLKDGSSGPEMVVIPAGTFQMGDIQGKGDDYEKPVHTVHIQKPFAIGRCQVTFDEHDKFANLTRRELPNDKGGVEGGGQSFTFHGMTRWNMPSGCLSRLASPIAFRQRRNGSMRLAAEVKTRFGLGHRTRSS